jgi:hypothetical protein
MTNRQQREIVHEVMTDKTAFPLLIAPRVAWPMAIMLRLSAKHPLRTEAGKKSHVALAKRFEKTVKARHPMPDIYKPEHLEPIMGDYEPLEVTITIRDAFEIVGGIQLCARHPDMPRDLLAMCVQAAHQLQDRIGEQHPDAWLVLQMGWDERYDVES